MLVSEIGEKGVRDPFILRNPLNGKYVIIATDLRIEAGKGWDAAQHAGSRNLIVWQSDNMTDWEGPESHEVGIRERAASGRRKPFLTRKDRSFWCSGPPW